MVEMGSFQRRKQRLKKERLEQEAEALRKENEEKRVLQEKRYRALRQNMDRMIDKGLSNCAELENKLGVKQADEYILNLILTEDPQEQHYSGTGLEERAFCYSQEAFAIIQSLEKLGKSSEEKILVEWEEPKSNGRKWFIKKYAHDMSHQDMLNRLAWITSEEYGDDINLWKKWVEFRKENGFMGTR